MLSTKHLSADFWLTKVADADQLLLTETQISARNSDTFARQSEMTELASLADSLTAAALRERIEKASATPAQPRFYADGAVLSAEQWRAYQHNLNTDGVQADNPIRFALVVKRTDLRSMPTEDRVHNEQMALDLDRFQETALFPGEAIAVLHRSRDNNWLLVQNYHYTGWVQAKNVALGHRQQVLEYAKQQPFLVVTGARVVTSFTPEMPAISQLLLDMGTRLPLLSTEDTGHNVHGQNPHASYIVKLPLRTPDGSLDFTPALIARQQDVSEGYLPYTAANILQQAFKFLGDRYGWGHDYDSRDCTGFIIEIYRSFGLLMPRNSGQQGEGSYGRNVRFSSQSSHADKLAAIRSAQPGDLIYRPGHVMLYLGEDAGEPFVIHSVHDLAYFTFNDVADADSNAKSKAAVTQPALYRGILNGVAVTPLTPLQLTTDSSYLDKIYAIKSLR
ncbi:SH3 domain-containing protein [Arsukibacterium sp. UBA3155]|uniref:SH3 domain-containing protein n=1 Tax=Arsukibacterium sp. UBA3155 TaxID=1946058 RepID=UPI0025C1411A|nr:SH3 domain-containing protein [Arsukibacterium sp. UBA3155]|tara:strand:+ start:69264 stop:70604 length:1341 start_codon:yes stop_codon:yes gene_type:complete